LVPQVARIHAPAVIKHCESAKARSDQNIKANSSQAFRQTFRMHRILKSKINKTVQYAAQQYAKVNSPNALMPEVTSQAKGQMNASHA